MRDLLVGGWREGGMVGGMYGDGGGMVGWWGNGMVGG